MRSGRWSDQIFFGRYGEEKVCIISLPFQMAKSILENHCLSEGLEVLLYEGRDRVRGSEAC